MKCGAPGNIFNLAGVRPVAYLERLGEAPTARGPSTLALGGSYTYPCVKARGPPISEALCGIALC